MVYNLKKIVGNTISRALAILIYILVLPFVLVCWLVDRIRGLYET